jgi:hypothetical protein
MFHANFAAYAEGVSEEVRNAGPANLRGVDLAGMKKSAPGEG